MKKWFTFRALAASAVDIGGLLLGMGVSALIYKEMEPIETGMPKVLEDLAKTSVVAMAAAAITFPTTYLSWRIANAEPTLEDYEDIDIGDIPKTDFTNAVKNPYLSSSKDLA